MIDADARHYEKCLRIAKKIDALQEKMRVLSDEELQRLAVDVKHRVVNNERIENVMVEAYALVREVDYRVLGQFPFFVQVVGAVLLYFGDIAEMKTGEGKTLTSTMTVYLRALEGKGVHVVTTNEYLSHRDFENLRGVYEFLGLRVGVNSTELNRIEKQEAFACDITYTTNSELGFDYLRDSFIMRKSERVLNHLHYALIDEVDSILIDEARTPLLISSNEAQDLGEFERCQHFVETLRGSDVEVDEESRSVYLTQEGVQRAQQYFKVANLYLPEHMPIVHRMNQALKANYIFKRENDYVVRNDEVLIVDEYTGRILPGREYSEGLHQAIQAKEGVTIKQENKTLATITYQNFFRLYDALSGMSGTAKSADEELLTTYNMRVFAVPTNRPMIRIDDEDAIYPTIHEKLNAIVEEAIQRLNQGQPVLLGTASIEDSLLLSREFTKRKIHHSVLNGTQDENEADVVARAGQKGTLTIATNIAGRGTDIPLGEGVEELGGLCILGFQRHDSKRIDDQLKGRAGRQGNAGYSKMYVSLQDALIIQYATERQKEQLASGKLSYDKMVHMIDLIQKQAEDMRYNSRKQLLTYDDELRVQRQIVMERRELLLDEMCSEGELYSTLTKYFKDFFKTQGWSLMNEEDLRHAVNYCKAYTNGNVNWSKLSTYKKEEERLDFIIRMIFDAYVLKTFDNRMFMKRQEQRMMLSSLDYVWREHVDSMMQLKNGINLRSTAGIKPEDAYREEGYALFVAMWKEYQEMISKQILNTIMYEEAFV